jgi:hypothetical protein
MNFTILTAQKPVFDATGLTLGELGLNGIGQFVQ